MVLCACFLLRLGRRGGEYRHGIPKNSKPRHAERSVLPAYGLMMRAAVGGIDGAALADVVCLPRCFFCLISNFLCGIHVRVAAGAKQRTSACVITQIQVEYQRLAFPCRRQCAACASRSLWCSSKPVLTSLLHYVNRTVGWVILYAVLGIMLLDIIITSITIAARNHQFKRLSELGDRVREAKRPRQCRHRRRYRRSGGHR